MTSTVDWHARYTQQARWTLQTRRYLYEKAGLARAQKVLEVGCGTGALLSEIPSLSRASAVGLDLNPKAAKQARKNAVNAAITCGDGHSLPYADQIFDITFCHFLLLWVRSPVDVLKELKRITRPGGAVLALAEPDYTGRIDFPAPLERLGRLQADSLRKQGADTEAGRKLRSWFILAGITPFESGIMAGGWSQAPSDDERQLEWAVIGSDLAGEIPAQEIQLMKEQDDKAWKNGERVLFVPTFFAWGRI
jgi:ubiquinone/menaquinone biosynthesis C-methylase UbiE